MSTAPDAKDFRTRNSGKGKKRELIWPLFCENKGKNFELDF